MDRRDEARQVESTRFAAELRRQFEGLDAADVGRESTPRRAVVAVVRHKWVVGGLLAAAAILAVTLVGLPGLRSSGPSQATAYEQTRAALVQVRGVHSLLMTSRSFIDHGQVKVTSHWVLATDGDWVGEMRYYTADGALREAPHFKAYDASTNTERFWSWGTTSAGLRAWRQRRPPCDLQAQPGQDASTTLPLFAGDFRSGALAALEQSHAKARSVTALGRPAWEVAVTEGLTDLFSRMILVIDKRSGIILDRILYDPEGAMTSRETVTRLRVNPKLPKGDPRVLFPADVSFVPLPPTTDFDWQAAPSRPMMTIADHGSRRTTVAGAAQRSGGRVMQASWLPPGFALQMVTYGWAVEVMYRAGLDYVLIGTNWGSDAPVPKPYENALTEDLTGGFLAGSKAYFDSANSAQVRGKGVVVWVVGSISHDEMLHVLNSLAPAE
jgi:hypothetical protein